MTRLVLFSEGTGCAANSMRQRQQCRSMRKGYSMTGTGPEAATPSLLQKVSSAALRPSQRRGQKTTSQDHSLHLRAIWRRALPHHLAQRIPVLLAQTMRAFALAVKDQAGQLSVHCHESPMLEMSTPTSRRCVGPSTSWSLAPSALQHGLLGRRHGLSQPATLTTRLCSGLHDRTPANFNFCFDPV